MASGQTLVVFQPANNSPPGTNYANLDVRNGSLVLSFDASTPWAALFGGVLPRHYGGGGLTLTLIWSALTGTTGNVVWSAEVERNQVGTDTIASDSFASAQTVISAAPGTAGVYKDAVIAFTNGAQMDSLAAGESFRLRIKRVADDATNDTMSGFAHLSRVEIRET